MEKSTIYKIVFLVLFFIFITTPSQARNMNILVQPFEHSGDPQSSWLSAGMTDTVICDLNRIKDITVISDKDRKQVLNELKFTHSGLVSEETTVKIGKMIGANVIFTGNYQVSGNRIRVNAKLINVETGKVESSTKLDGTLDAIFDLQDKVIFSLMSETEKIKIADLNPVRFTEEDKKKIEEKYKTTADAYEWYSKGLEIEDINPRMALDYLKKAIKIDPNYTNALILAGYIAGRTLNLFDESYAYFEKAESIFKARV